MELTEAIARRRSIRRFEPWELSDEQVERLLESARLCQSAKNRQPWRFMVLRGSWKDRVAEIMAGRLAQDDFDMPGYGNSAGYSARVIQEAPVLLLVLREKDLLWKDSDYLSIGAAIEHICLEAVNLGLGALWIRDTVYSEKAILQAIGYPELDLVSGIAVGYAAEAPAPRPRFTLNELMLRTVEGENMR